MENSKIIIIGAGQAATQAISSLRQLGHKGEIKLFGNENVPPYQRPPLSKAYLMGDTTIDRLKFRADEQWAIENIETHFSDEIIKIEPTNNKVFTQTNEYSYDKLIIATGARVRKLEIEGSRLKGIHYLRTLAEADAFKIDLENAQNIAVIGAGYIGLESAAIANKKGKNVTILEAATRVLARVATNTLSEYYYNLHTSMGNKIIHNAKIKRIIGDDTVKSIELDNGDIINADIVLIGIGVIPNIEFAMDAGIICDNGINTNEYTQTNFENIYAIGDCANRIINGKRIRLESVHNAIEQGKIAASHIMNAPMPKLEAPWFWSDQFDKKLQIVGLFNGADKTIIRGSLEDGKFALFHLENDNTVLAIDAINSPPEFLIGKNLVLNKMKLAPEIISDLSLNIKEVAAKATL